ncbi:hypothetical protein HPB47_026571, partial [Ixodes persulcatus]
SDSSDMARNPFAALFPSMVDVQAFVQSGAETAPRDFPPLPVTEKALATQDMDANGVPVLIGHVDDATSDDLASLLEEIFRVTTSDCNDAKTSKGPPHCVLLPTFKDSKKCLDLNTLNELVFERLVLDDPQNHVVSKSKYADQQALADAGETRVVFYLYQCFSRLNKVATKLENEDYETIEKTIVSQASTCLCHCEIYPGKKIPQQVFYLLQEYHAEGGHQESLESFLKKCADCIKGRFDAEEEQVSLLEVLSHSFNLLKKKFGKVSIANRELFVLVDILKYFTKSVSMAMALLDFSTPAELVDLRSFQESLLGAPLCVSCLPRKEADPFEFFERPSQALMNEHAITESNLWLPLKGLAVELHNLFYSLLRLSPETRNRTLTWIGHCITACSERGKLWNNQVSELFMAVQSGDGFALNLGAVLLRLARPFSEPYSPKLLKVQHQYCSFEPKSEQEANASCMHIR